MLGVLRWIIHQTSATPLCAANAHNKSVCVCMRGAHSLERGRLNFWREWIWERDCGRAQCRLSPRWWCVTTAGLFADLILGVGLGWGVGVVLARGRLCLIPVRTSLSGPDQSCGSRCQSDEFFRISQGKKSPVTVS